MALHLAFDIGTRKVVGLLTKEERKGLRIVAAERAEHQGRAMFDGQIHDVVQVARLVKDIKKKLEARAGGPLKEAAVAAAGRALRTFSGQAYRDLSGLEEISADQVLALELEAVQAAQRALAEAMRSEAKPGEYHYVGHSVVASHLDGVPLANLVGQRGKEVTVEVVATFLPRGVVDSLLAVLHRCDLELTALTLEPIAAISVVVPPTMRHLNLALVDIGAGTSDIALTRKGAVVAYDMVPMAGDEVTEALSGHYLLDFAVGETVKRQIMGGGKIVFTDILGNRYEEDAAQVAAACHPAVAVLAEQISNRILKLNGGQPPQAVLLVGGGAQSPGLAEALGNALGLPKGRVAVRGREAISGVIGAPKLLGGPDAVTPIGIAATARVQGTVGFAYVHVNGVGVRLFNPASLTVADALLAAGVDMRALQPKVGRGLTIFVNGELKLIPGSFGRPAKLLCNGEPATLDTPIAHRDRINWHPAVDGAPAQARVADVVPPLSEKALVVNGEPVSVRAEVLVNGAPVAFDHELADNDEVLYRGLETCGQALVALGYEGVGEPVSLTLEVDGKRERITRPRYELQLNGEPAHEWSPVADGDQLLVKPLPPLTLADLPGPGAEALTVTINGQPMTVAAQQAKALVNGRPADLETPLRDGDRITWLSEPGSGLILADLLPLAGLDGPPPAGASRLRLLVNGAPADFVTQISEGDSLELGWE